MFYCIFCGHKLKWQSDFTFEEFGEYGDGVVGVYTCSNSGKCGTEFEIKTPIEDDANDKSSLYSTGDIHYFSREE